MVASPAPSTPALRATDVSRDFEARQEQNKRAYATFFHIENVLRELAMNYLVTHFGNRWIKQGVPGDIKEKIRSGLSYERKIPWRQLTCFQPLYYIDFPDLQKLILTGDNWKTIFSNIYPSRSAIESAFADLSPIRNKIAHNRLVSNNDLAVLDAALLKLIENIDPALHTASMQSALHHVPVSDIIDSIIRVLTNLSDATLKGDPINSQELTPLAATEYWWFDALFLEVQLPDASPIVTMCYEYAQILPGLGQALVRKQWAAQRNMKHLIHQLLDPLRTLSQ